MKRILLPLFILFSIFLASCSGGNRIQKNANGNTSGTIKVMTYNVHHCNPPSKSATGDIDIDTIVGVIRKQNPDLVALQEIDDHTSRSGAFNEAEVMAKKLNMHYYFGKAIDYGGGGYGVAILSKYPLSDTKTIALPSTEGFKGETRVLALATITLPNGKAIRFSSTHLEVSSGANRDLQIKEINRIAASETIPFIIGGDFNSAEGSPVIQALDQVFTRTCYQCAPTIPVDRPTKAIDFIAFTKTSPFKVLSHQVIPEQYASDHLPVVAELQYVP